MTSSCKSSFSRAVHVALGGHSATESAAFLLQSVDSLDKARQGLLGSLLSLKSGGWAYILLDSSAVSFKTRGSGSRPALTGVIDQGRGAKVGC